MRGRIDGVARAALGALLVALALAWCQTAAADLAGEQALAEKYAPVVRLVAEDEEFLRLAEAGEVDDCDGRGDPYDPLDIDVLLGDEPTVALRGPWTRADLVEIGPVAADLVNRFEYHLDFPGDPLNPGCSFAIWARRLQQGTKPVVYAHVATEATRPGKLSLQYWLFYVFNDFNNTHEGDWEMIQLVFDADTPEEALQQEPVKVGYSAHEGAEQAGWEDEKLERVDGTHPVVFPGEGSHANKFTEALYLGASAEAGVGCDDTRGPHRELRPDVKTIPSDPAAAKAAFPWIDFEGRWGELQPAFFNGPTGPNLKTQWTRPITWSEGWHDRSYAVPTGGVFGTGATDVFCSGVEKGSRALILLLRSPGLIVLLVAALVALFVFVALRATWTPVAPLRLAHRRSWGQILAASARMYVKRPALFLGIGLLLIPLSFVITFLQWLLLGGLDWLGIADTGEAAGGSALLAVVVGTTLALIGLALVQAATARALAEVDEGRGVNALDAYRLALTRVRPLLAAIVGFVVVWAVLTTFAPLIPVAIWFAVRWCLLAPVAELEGHGGRSALRRSAELVRRRWVRTASLVGISAAVALTLGPLLGALLIFVVDVPLATLNIVAGLVYAGTLPFVALVTCYVYFDARARVELEPLTRPSELPAEFELSPSS